MRRIIKEVTMLLSYILVPIGMVLGFIVLMIAEWSRKRRLRET